MANTSFIDALGQYKIALSQFLLSYLDKEQVIFRDQSLNQEVFKRLKKFVVTGKMARGGMFLLTYDVLSTNNKKILKPEDQLAIAAALELTHSGLLIHDDIIDRDELRRGQASIWQQFHLDAVDKNYHEPLLYGQSLAICTANICYYLAQNLINHITLESQNKQKLLDFFNIEIMKVNFAEMLDVKLAWQSNEITLEDILAMYRDKTARYTFSLPMSLAARLTFTDKKTIKILENCGEKLGLIFQIKDDEIGLFADEKVSGKNVASDIREGKRTIYFYYLKQKINKNFDKKIQQRFFNIYGHDKFTPADLEFCRQLFRDCAYGEVESFILNLKNDLENWQTKIVDKKLQKLLTEALDFNLNRQF